MSRYGPLGAEKYSARRALYLICIAMTYSRDNCLFRQGSVSTVLVAHFICILDRMMQRYGPLGAKKQALYPHLHIYLRARATYAIFVKAL